MQRSFSLYRNMGYLFLLLLPLVAAGFYSTYFSVIFKPTPSIVHIHFALMATWLLMLIVQPFLIKYKKYTVHRAIGKLSYVVVPLLLIAGFLMIRFSYYREVNAMDLKIEQGLSELNHDDVLKKGAIYEAIAFLYLAWFIVFYALAIYRRRNTHAHSRYMLATGVMMLGPTIDRILYFSLHMEKLPGGLPLEYFSFLLIDVLILLLIWNDYRKGRPAVVLGTCFFIFTIGELLYFTIPQTEVWKVIVSILMQAK